MVAVLRGCLAIIGGGQMSKKHGREDPEPASQWWAPPWGGVRMVVPSVWNHRRSVGLTNRSSYPSSVPLDGGGLNRSPPQLFPG